MEDLLSGSAQIDGRSLADLLDYFVQLSQHINYYHTDLSVSDWKPFFRKSTPFVLAAMTKYNQEAIREKAAFYTQLFDKQPSEAGLQLLIHYFFYGVIDKLNTWHQQVKDSELPVAFALEKLIKDKLQSPTRQFIGHANAAVQGYCIKPLDLYRLYDNSVWGFDVTHLYSIDASFKSKAATRWERLIILRDSVLSLLSPFLDVIQVATTSAELSMEQSLLPLKAELQERHSPHLAILFAFLKLFRYLQDDLNGFTKKHLDFFYQQVLQLKTREATPDKAHIVVEIQKQLDQYLLKEGLLVKDGKDNNKAEVLFALDDEIVVNQAQVADQRTLFLNHQTYSETTYLEGAYIAPDVSKADGVDKDFPEGKARSFSTLGAKDSKYIDPEHSFIQPYPNARLGFVLASPVLLLQEGTRTVNITLACLLTDDYCKELTDVPPNLDPCCEGREEHGEGEKKESARFEAACELYEKVQKALETRYYYVSQPLIEEAIKKGVGVALIDRLKKMLTTQTTQEEGDICYCPVEEVRYDRVFTQEDFYREITEQERVLLMDIISPRTALRLSFSGEKEWVSPNEIKSIAMTPEPADFTCGPEGSIYPFTLAIKAVLTSDQPSVTFYDSEQLKEDLNTTMPVVKIELDETVKLDWPPPEQDQKCCLDRKPKDESVAVSLYHFFRNVTVQKEGTEIQVEVCGLKNLVVQNDESVQDVNAPIYPFGTRPDVVDFDVDTISKVYCLTQALIDDAVANGITNTTEDHLEAILGAKKSHQLPSNLEDFLNIIPVAADRPTVQSLFNDPTKKYCQRNLVGPNFYIGSKEVFCKEWNDVFININWKDRPVNFNEYYKAYWVDPTDYSNYGINEEDFQINIAVLDNGLWRKEKDHALPNSPPPNTVLNPDTRDNNRPLFEDDSQTVFCAPENPREQTIHVANTFFDGYEQDFWLDSAKLDRYTVNTPFGFLRINLQNQDFLHKNYALVMARQMMALGKFPNEFMEGATYSDAGGTVFVFESTALKLAELDSLITQTRDEADAARTSAQTLNSRVTQARDPGSDGAEDITDAEFTTNPNLNAPLQDTVTHAGDAFDRADDTRDKYIEIKNNLGIFDFITGKLVDKLAVLIPNEPWTPIIKELSLDYTATATAKDIDLIHLYPYEGTYKHEAIAQQPTLLPTFCDEGTLFLGLQDLVPGSNVNLLFQLAEATADSEADREDVRWHYLDNNQWKALRPGFEVLDDATHGLTTSGIVELALPANMTSDNTILPKGLHWIKAAISHNSRSVSETIGIHAQAVRATFTNQAANDRQRLQQALPAGSLAKLQVADARVKKVNQPYDSFDGRVPEVGGHYYVRVSEHLRHKGRAIQKFDYERLALEAFPQLFKVKCINHSFALNAHRYVNDFPVAPGYVLLAVIPDLNQLKANASFEPRVPVSLLEAVREYLRKRTSPFVRLRVMNPRYERVHFCLKVKFYPGKDIAYYQEKLKRDIRDFLAPWAIGQYDKLTFGQCIYRSDMVRFLETRDYLDYILDLKMKHEKEEVIDDQPRVCPLTPRSILIAGSLDVCVTSQDCETWEKCYDANQQEVDCCGHPKIALVDDCYEPRIT